MIVSVCVCEREREIKSHLAQDGSQTRFKFHTRQIHDDTFHAIDHIFSVCVCHWEKGNWKKGMGA